MDQVDPIKLREKLLDRRVEAIKESIQRARTTWLTSTLLTFVIGTVIFNATAGYTSQQITRRSRLVGALSQEFDAMQQAIANDAVFRLSLIDGAGELGYLKELLPV